MVDTYIDCEDKIFRDCWYNWRLIEAFNLDSKRPTICQRLFNWLFVRNLL